jgi:sugar/nucleoside kinase (ribokinase family)
LTIATATGSLGSARFFGGCRRAPVVRFAITFGELVLPRFGAVSSGWPASMRANRAQFGPKSGGARVAGRRIAPILRGPAAAMDGSLMTPAPIDVVGIGNAIVDVLARADEAFLAREGLAKGTMTLIDAERAEALYRLMGPAIEASGGSAGNTMAGIASLGGSGAYIGKVRDDFLGEVFRHDITAIGVRLDTPPATSGPATARCLILVTPDGQRTMNTYLGACVELGPDDIAAELIAAAQVIYLEGYLFDPPLAQEAFRKAAGIAHGAGRKVALSLSDPFCVGRHRPAFRDLVERHIDILFANEAEICALYETVDFAAAAAAVRGHVEIAALTRSEQGSLVLGPDGEHAVAAVPTGVVDTTGAGDLYASGFLFGLTRGRPLPICGRIGSLCAAEIIGHFGARPERGLRDLVAAAGVL